MFVYLVIHIWINWVRKEKGYLLGYTDNGKCVLGGGKETINIYYRQCKRITNSDAIGTFIATVEQIKMRHKNKQNNKAHHNSYSEKYKLGGK